MNMRIKISGTMLMLLLPFITNGQIIKALFGTRQEIIEQSIDSAVCIVRQDYVLADTSVLKPNVYGMGGKPYFGRIYALGIISGGKLWCPSQILTPWLLDTNFTPYLKADSIVPKLSAIAVRPVLNHEYTVWDFDSLNIFDAYDSVLLHNGIIGLKLKDQLPGLELVREMADTTGWVVFASTETALSVNDTSKISFTSYKVKTKLGQEHLRELVKPQPTGPSFIGGVFLSTHASVGHIDFFMAGLIIKSDSEWYIHGIPARPPSPSSVMDKKLTPIQPSDNQQRKEKKKVK